MGLGDHQSGAGFVVAALDGRDDSLRVHTAFLLGRLELRPSDPTRRRPRVTSRRRAPPLFLGL